MLELENITIGYAGTMLLKNAYACIPSGHLAAMLGRNGTGKSTLMRAISGLGRLYGGSIRICRKDTHGLGRDEMARMVSFVGTERIRISNLKCRDLVALGRSPYTGWSGRTSAEDERIIGRSLELVGMSGYSDRSMDRMSDGECQKIMIARALAQDTPVMLLDEPTAFLDFPGKRSVVSLLHRLAAEEGKTIVFSTHDLELSLEKSDDIIILDPPELITGQPGTIEGHINRIFGI